VTVCRRHLASRIDYRPASASAALRSTWLQPHCPTPAKSEAIEYLQVGPTENRYSIAWTIFIYSVVSVNRNIVRYNKYLVVVTLIVVLSLIVIVIVISLEHSTVVVDVFKFKFEYPIYSIFREKFNRTRSVPL